MYYVYVFYFNILKYYKENRMFLNAFLRYSLYLYLEFRFVYWKYLSRYLKVFLYPY